MPYDKPEIFNALCVYRELGKKFGRLEKYEKSLPYLNAALRTAPGDIGALLYRARYSAQACRYNDALKDIKTLFEASPDNIYVDAVLCLVKYLCCHFEDAMVDNLRKMKIRKKPDHFVMGVMHCEDAIRNNVGTRAGHPLRDHFLIIRRMAWKKNFEKSQPYQPKTTFKKKKMKEVKDDELTFQLAAPKKKFPATERKTVHDTNTSTNLSPSSSKKFDVASNNVLNEGSSIQETLHDVVDINQKIPPIKDYPFRPIQRYTTNVRNLMAERYLDKMFHDKIFLQKMRKEQAVKSPNNTGVKRIEDLVKKSSKYIHYNQELLRARRPFFLLRLQDVKAGGKLKDRQLERERTLMKYCEAEAQNMIQKIEQALTEPNLPQMIELAEKMYIFCENTPKKSLPNRNTYLLQLFALVRDGFYSVKSVRDTMTKEQKQIRVSIILGIQLDKEGSTDSLIMQFKNYFVNKKKQCEIIEKRVRNCVCREELVWLYHELSRLRFELKQYEHSKAYATKCWRESYILKDDKWIINAMFLMMRIHVINRNKNGTILELRNCRKIAIKLDDPTLDEFIQQCMEVLNDTPMEAISPTKMLEMRCKSIMKLMTSDEMRMKAELIFQRINALPPSKRMSVMPGIHYPEISVQKKPSSSGEERSGALSRRPSRRNTGTNRRGLNFLKLIQHHIDT